MPSDPENYYEARGFVPDDMIGDIRKARIVGGERQQNRGRGR
jgi:hypothetical protein